MNKQKNRQIYIERVLLWFPHSSQTGQDPDGHLFQNSIPIGQ